jgi:hypothetical protein
MPAGQERALDFLFGDDAEKLGGYAWFNNGVFSLRRPSHTIFRRPTCCSSLDNAMEVLTSNKTQCTPLTPSSKSHKPFLLQHLRKEVSYAFLFVPIFSIPPAADPSYLHALFFGSGLMAPFKTIQLWKRTSHHKRLTLK